MGDFIISLMSMNRPCGQKINETQDLKDTLNEIDLIHIYSTFHPNMVEYTFSLSAQGTLSRIDHNFGHKASL